MRQMSLDGIDRPGDEAGKPVTRKICDRIYGLAHQRVDNYARYVRELIEQGPEQTDLCLSDDFNRRRLELEEEIDLEWGLDRPDLARFRRLVAEWESLYISALYSEVEKWRSSPD